MQNKTAFTQAIDKHLSAPDSSISLMDLASTADKVAAQLDAAAVNVQRASTCLAATNASLCELQISGKVPAQAHSACETLRSGHVAVRHHVSALQQCLLPCSAQIVSITVAYLQLVSADPSRLIALVQSGHLSQQCKYFADALSCAQKGYEALASDLLELQKTLRNAERKIGLDMQAAREHLDNKLVCRRVAKKAGPAAAGVAAGAAAALVGFALFPPLAFVAGPMAGVWAAEEAEESAEDALGRAEQQLARTEDIARFCDKTSTQLRHAMDLVAATSCVAHLAGFLNNLAASTDRASSTAGRLEARSADPQQRGSIDALAKVFLNQVRTVTTAGSAFAATVSHLASSSGDQPSKPPLELKPAYQRVEQAAQELEALQQEIAKQLSQTPCGSGIACRVAYSIGKFSYKVAAFAAHMLGSDM